MFVCKKLNNIVMEIIEEIRHKKLALSQIFVSQMFYINIQF